MTCSTNILRAENAALDHFGRGFFRNPFAARSPEEFAYSREWRDVARSAAEENVGEAARKIFAALGGKDRNSLDIRTAAGIDTGRIVAEAAVAVDATSGGKKRKTFRDALAAALHGDGSFAAADALAGYDDRAAELLGGPFPAHIASRIRSRIGSPASPPAWRVSNGG